MDRPSVHARLRVEPADDVFRRLGAPSLPRALTLIVMDWRGGGREGPLLNISDVRKVLTARNRPDARRAGNAAVLKPRLVAGKAAVLAAVIGGLAQPEP